MKEKSKSNIINVKTYFLFKFEGIRNFYFIVVDCISHCTFLQLTGW